ncbi:hypothetical protein L1987_42947 [Smallanthus sonchifolius]|uniref:Uncharacterized protein n=1 Tax=Smallanthus sonchifolius TaxID=185202 RepID=A0ACB9GKB0_9ASTR|nr:hypothetical protein L1987_42947 [Smallanthus sonchifolius]
MDGLHTSPGLRTSFVLHLHVPPSLSCTLLVCSSSCDHLSSSHDHYVDDDDDGRLRNVLLHPYDQNSRNQRGQDEKIKVQMERWLNNNLENECRISRIEVGGCIYIRGEGLRANV